MTRDPLQQALDAIADATAIDWAALESDTPEESRQTLRSLREIASIALTHAAPASGPARPTPLEWGFLHVEEHIARGAHGDVYRAWDPRLDRRVALKLLRDDGAGGDRASLAITEGRLLARVRHPNVVTVHGADRIDGQAGIWMEFIEGRTLRETVDAQGPLPVADAILVGLAICDGLVAIHAAGLVHRDVKAQNAMRDASGHITLMDLGAGRDKERVDDRFEGTPMYLAPEVLRGAPSTAAADVYALGVLLFFIVTGRYPVAAASLEDLRARHLAGGRERLGDVRTVPAPFSAVVDRALSEDPANRFASATDMRAAIDAARRPIRRRMSVTALLTATLAIVVVSAATWVMGLADASPEPAWGEDTIANGSPAGAAPPRTIVGRGSRDGGGPPSPPAQTAPGPGPAPSDRERRPSQLRLPPYDMGVPSRDGRYIPYVDWNGDVWLWTTESGESRRLTKDESFTASARETLASPSGDRVAYGWLGAGGAYELRLIDANGRWPQTVLGRQTVYEPIPLDWSRDGLTILCWLRQKNGMADLVLAPIDGGAPRLLTTFQAGDVTNGLDRLSSASLSPDGRFAVTTRRTPGQQHRYDVVIVGTDGSEPRTLVEGVSNDGNPGWTADGQKVVFLRPAPQSPATDLDAWAVRVHGGMTLGDATVVAANTGGGGRTAVIDNATLYLLTTTGSPQIYGRSVDLTGDTHPGPPARLPGAEVGRSVAPSWSPDGRSIAYFTNVRRTSPGSTPLRTLTIMDLQSGRIRKVKPLGFQGAYRPRWFPDSQSVVVWGGADFGVQLGYYRVDVETGETSALRVFDEASVPAFPGHFQISAHGDELLYDDAARGIVSHNLQSGHETLVLDKGRRTGLRRFSISPDGQSIAFAAEVTGDGIRITTIEIQTAGGPPRELFRAVAPEWVDLQTFTPDGQGLIFTRAGLGLGMQLWRMPVGGGEAHNMHMMMPNQPNAMSLSPDGRRMIYSERSWQQDLRIVPLALATPQAARQH